MMDKRDRHELVTKLFLQASELSGDERREFLQHSCGDDAPLRAEIEHLLEHDHAEDIFKTPPSRAAGREDDAGIPRSLLAMPTRIGEYEVLGVLGEGGMGVIYRAEQTSPHRTVALKVIRPGVVSTSALRRFELEAQTLAMLHHPGIARIYEAGTFDAGHGPQPFFAMELVEGLPLLTYADEHELDTRDRLELMISICDAIEHAHQKGVIHRDLKPANILVTDDGQPIILDFGVARMTDADVQLTTIGTLEGQLIGTVPYMSPEQIAAPISTTVAGSAASMLDTRSDVYALGVLAYELLTGRLPYDISDKLIHEAAQIVRDHDPTPISSIDRAFRGDLDTIIAMALEKDRDRRYSSAAAFAEDIRRFLHDEPIVARPASAIYQMRKFARRNRALVTGASIAVVALVLGVIGSGIMLARTLSALETVREREHEALAARDAEREQRTIAEQHQRELRKVIDFQASMIERVDPESVGTSMMQLVHNAMMETDSPSDSPEDGSWPLLDTAATTDIARSILDEHLLQPIAASLSDTFGDEPVVEAILRDRVGQAYYALGLYWIALEHFETAVSLLHDERGVDDLESLAAMSNLATVLRVLGRLDESAVVLREILETRTRMRGEDHPDTLRSMSSLAVTYRQLHRLDEAERLANKALEGRLSVLGEDHPETLTSLNNSASVLQMRGKGNDAAIMYQRALDASRRVLGPDHPDTLAALSNLASLLPQLGRFDESEQLYAELLEHRQRVLGSHHPDTLRVYNNVANLHMQRGNVDAAEKYYLLAVEGRIAALGENHPDTLHAIGNLAHLLRHLGRLDEAEEYSRQALAGLEQRFGPTHQRVLVTKGNLGAILLDQGRVEEAESLYREALDGFTATLGEHHRFTAIATTELGHLYMAKAAYDDAASVFLLAEERAVHAFPPTHPQQWLARASRGNALAQLGRSIEAEKLLIDALNGLTSALGESHPVTMAVADDLEDLQVQKQ